MAVAAPAFGGFPVVAGGLGDTSAIFDEATRLL